jgi:integrase
MKKRERGTGSLWLRGGIWWAAYYFRGRQMRVSTGETDPKKAEKFLRRKLGAISNGIQEDSRSLRYETLRDAYLEDYAVNGKKSLRRDREGNAYLESVKRLDPFFAGCRVVEINSDLLRQFQREMQTAGYANGSINRSLAALRKMFTLAHRDGRVHNLPFFPMLPESKPRQGTLPQQKYAELLAGLPGYLRIVVAIGYATGMRLGEVLGLLWENIVWMDRVIRLEDSKNGEAREIPFSGELETMLREQYTRRQDGCDRVCFRIDALGHARHIGDFRKVWRRVCVKIGLGKWEPVTDKVGNAVYDPRRGDRLRSTPKPKRIYNGLIFHDLRRSFISAGEHAGAPRHEVMMISGHKTESVYKRYAISNREQRRSALAQIDEYRSKHSGESRTQNEHNSGVSDGEQSVVN